MSWSNKTSKLWKAFEDAVLCRDKKQFEIYLRFKKSQQEDKKIMEEENELTF